MKSAFLLPFFGPLPSYFQFWAKSCEINKDAFHWFVYSDAVSDYMKVNHAVTLIPYSYDHMIADFEQILNLRIARDNPRKVCSPVTHE